MNKKQMLEAAAILLMSATLSACGQKVVSNELENGADAIQEAMAMMNTENESQEIADNQSTQRKRWISKWKFG